MKKPLSEMTKSDYETLKLTGLLWEIYPDAPDTYGGIMSKHDEKELLTYINADNEVKSIMYPQSIELAKQAIAKAEGI